ncbi:unnamed protein product [Lymnaea stagnalis]|uniref:Cell death regulator Aven n=1 Tax=Lymnaea stagnalis TaxID=6523 RepID=A0AAV2H1J6_LYMST
MRPDEHKKKKNEAYKKKHGLTSGGEERAGKHKDKSGKANTAHKSLSGDTNKTKTAEHHKNEPHDMAGHNQARALEKTNKNTELSRDPSSGNAMGAYHLRKNLGSSDSSSSDSGNDEKTGAVKNKRKNYRRREIVSNWNKYELEPNQEEEKIVSRGENFEKLISMAGKAMSHFRFKDELEWEQDDELTETDNGDMYSQVLSINPADLIRNLSCIPVHQILGISQDVFPSTQIGLMIDVAKRNKDAFELALGEELRPHVEFHELQNKHVTDTNGRTQMVETLHPRMSSVPESSSGICISQDENNVVKNSSNINRDISKGFSNINTVDSGQQSGRLSLQDEDLDLLLGLDSNGKVPGQEQGNTPSEPPKNGQTKTTGKAAQESDNLEDWLDSVLDD